MSNRNRFFDERIHNVPVNQNLDVNRNANKIALLRLLEQQQSQQRVAVYEKYVADFEELWEQLTVSQRSKCHKQQQQQQQQQK